MTNLRPVKIAIASGKGGTGKTLLATNLAAFMSTRRETLLVDLDVEEPDDALFIRGKMKNASLQYKMIPEWVKDRCTLCGECTRNCKFHAVIQIGNFVAVFKELCHSCYACSELCPVDALPMHPHKMGEVREFTTGALHFMEARLEIGEEQAVPLIRKAHHLVDASYPNIPLQIFDCPPGTSCPVVTATQNAHFVILVTEPTPFGFNDLKLAVETMRQMNKEFGVVINRYGIGSNQVETYCEKEHIPILAKIPFDTEIAKLYSKGMLIYGNSEAINSPPSQIAEFMERNLINE